MEFKVVYYFGARPTQGSKVRRGTITLTDSELAVSGTETTRLPIFAIASCELRRIKGVGTVAYIESELEPLAIAVYRWIWFGSLVIPNRLATADLSNQINEKLQNFHSLRAP